MTMMKTLRGRLMLSLALVFVMALGASSLIDEVPARVPSLPLTALDREPFQDGVVLALFSLPALALIWLISSWSLRPLTRICEQAKHIGPDGRHARLSQDGLPGEIVPLVDAVNAALDRMADAFDAERRFTQNAAHELRTPLAVLCLRLQRARQINASAETIDWPAIDRDVARMNRLVAQLLDLARRENAARTGSGAPCAPVNLARVARQAAAELFPLAESQQRDLRVNLPHTLIVAGRADDLCDAVRNLIENALVHGSGAITVSALADTAEQARAVLLVCDEGSGVPPEARQAVFDRFSKGALSEGSGLGLALVRQVAGEHGGQAWVPPEGGHVRLAIPLI